ncbi:MAG: FecR family protein [Desulfobacterales bacterium]|nr:FecR family protein [Desulfobacterales bacterium]
MKNYLFLFVTSCFLIIISTAFAQEKAALIKTATGNVNIQRGEKVLTANQGSDLLTEDILLTGDKSYAGLIFTDGTRFTLGPNSQFQLNQYRFEPKNQAYAFSMYLEKGSGLYNSGKISKLAPQAVKLSTPKATVGIRGTRFIINVEN